MSEEKIIPPQEIPSNVEMREGLLELIASANDQRCSSELIGTAFRAKIEVLRKIYLHMNAASAAEARRCATCHAVLADGPQPLAAYEDQSTAKQNTDGHGVAWKAIAVEHAKQLSVLGRDVHNERLGGIVQGLAIAMQKAAIAETEALSPAGNANGYGCVKPDTDKQVFFYEQDFYVLSNFSSFELEWRDKRFPTSEHAYHCEKFTPGSYAYDLIRISRSAHDAFKVAEKYKAQRRSDWDDVKVSIMRDILRAKAEQHEYVRRKLLATGDRELIEDSWRDDFWGWGPNRNGKNMLGRLWMGIREELRIAEIERTMTPLSSTEGDRG